MTGPTGIDESWGRADWGALARAGVQVVSLYLSRDPSKNATTADILAAHAHGIGILLNWEDEPGAPLRGASQGSADARDWLAQKNALIAAVGYAPAGRLSAIFSCDTPTSPDQYPVIDPYYAATAALVRPAGCLNGVYGDADVVEHLHAAGLTDVEWQTYAWSNGRLSGEADFYQYLNGQYIGGASVDFDRVIHVAQLGAWWPPGHALDTLNATLLEDDLSAAEVDQIVTTVTANVNNYQKALYDDPAHEFSQYNIIALQRQLLAGQAALTSAIKAATGGVDMAAVQAAAEAGAKAALAATAFTVTPQ